MIGQNDALEGLASNRVASWPYAHAVRLGIHVAFSSLGQTQSQLSVLDQRRTWITLDIRQRPGVRYSSASYAGVVLYSFDVVLSAV